MTEAEILKFQKRGKYVAAKRGYPELADDFAQELLLTFVENPDRHSTVEQLFIDYLRGTYGDTRSHLGTERSRTEHTMLSLDTQANQSEREISLYDVLAAPQPDSESERTRRECSILFGGREAEIYDAYFVDEEVEKSIGERFGITESRVSQILKPMKKEIQEYYLIREVLERMEWDPDYGKFQVDWIRL